jgi:hypothetical protein
MQKVQGEGSFSLTARVRPSIKKPRFIGLSSKTSLQKTL